MENNRIDMFQAGIIFSISVVLFIAFSVVSPFVFSSFYTAGVVGEVIPILIPALAGIAIFKRNFKRSLKLNGFRVSDVILVIFITICYMPFSMAINALNMWIVKLIFGQNILIEIPIPTTVGELIISILVIGLTAAVCEEVLFRGVLQGSMEKLGKTGMLIIVSLLFAAFHFNIEHFLGIFVLSLLIGFIVYRTNSLYMGMLAHFVNNTVAVVMSFIAGRIPEEMVEESVAASEAIPEIAEIVVLAGIVIFFTAVACVLLYALYKNTEKVKTVIDKTVKTRSRDFLAFLPGLLIMAVMFLITIAIYFADLLPGF